GPAEDLASYPRDFARDSALCEAAGVDLIFHPEPETMYQPDFCTFVDMNGLTGGLCGRSRPVHFRGVCTVVTKLFHIFAPDRAYFGQKDAQQLAVIRRMARDLDMDVEIIGCPIIREPDGLAKSSRNQYLNGTERQAALVLSRALGVAQAALGEGETDCGALRAAMTACIGAEPLARIDYAEIVDSLTLQPLQTVDRTALIALAVYIGKTRLIDNFTWEVARA
ncbi:MAG: pantoate--beta-alanine ligase, partial [Intestinibacillus sp.]